MLADCAGRQRTVLCRALAVVNRCIWRAAAAAGGWPLLILPHNPVFVVEDVFTSPCRRGFSPRRIARRAHTAGCTFWPTAWSASWAANPPRPRTSRTWAPAEYRNRFGYADQTLSNSVATHWLRFLGCQSSIPRTSRTWAPACSNCVTFKGIDDTILQGTVAGLNAPLQDALVLCQAVLSVTGTASGRVAVA